MSHQVFVYTVQPEELFDGIAPREVSPIETPKIVSFRISGKENKIIFLISDITA
jgi:hypothetical protein